MEKKHLTLQDRHNIEQMLNARKSFTALRITGKPEQNEETDRNKTKKLTLCKRLTNTPIRQKEKLPTRQLIQKLIGHDISTCPVCGTLLRQFASLSPPLVS